jgi:hypothetical protein
MKYEPNKCYTSIRLEIGQLSYNYIKTQTGGVDAE